MKRSTLIMLPFPLLMILAACGGKGDVDDLWVDKYEFVNDGLNVQITNEGDQDYEGKFTLKAKTNNHGGHLYKLLGGIEEPETIKSGETVQIHILGMKKPANFEDFIMVTD